MGLTTLFFAADESSGSNVLVLADYRELLETEPQQVDLNEYVELQSIGLQDSLGQSTTVTEKDVVVDGMKTVQLRMDRPNASLMMDIIIGTEPRAMCGSMPIIVQVTSTSDNVTLMEKVLDSFKILPNAGMGVDCNDRSSLSLIKTDFVEKDIKPRIAIMFGPTGWRQTKDLYVINADGSDLTRLTTEGADHVKGYIGPTDGANFVGASWSPDGSRLLFASERGNIIDKATGRIVRKMPSEIFVINNLDGSTQTMLAGAIIDEFVDNHARASLKFDLQTLSISGLVDMVDHDSLSHALHVTIVDPDVVDSLSETIIGVKCIISNPKEVEALGLSGSYVRELTDISPLFVTVKGVFSEFNGVDVVLDGCSVKENEQRLTKHDAMAAEGSWSPDGRRIAFVSDSHGTWFSPSDYRDIYIMNADGSNEIRLTDNSKVNSCISWAPDAKRIAFCSRPRWVWDDTHIYTINADGSNQVPLTKDPLPNFQYNINWSPDGNRLILEQIDELLVLNADGSNEVRINGNLWDDLEGSSWSSEDTFRRASWSPDGSLITFEAWIDGNSDIYVVDADGSNLKRLTESPEYDGGPVWSPDGSSILFKSDRGGRAEGEDLYLMDPDGSNERRLTSDRHISGLIAWSPYGNQIAFLSKRDLGGGDWQGSGASSLALYVIDDDGTNETLLINTGNPNGCWFWWASP